MGILQIFWFEDFKLFKETSDESIAIEIKTGENDNSLFFCVALNNTENIWTVTMTIIVIRNGVIRRLEKSTWNCKKDYLYTLIFNRFNVIINKYFNRNNFKMLFFVCFLLNTEQNQITFCNCKSFKIVCEKSICTVCILITHTIMLTIERIF